MSDTHKIKVMNAIHHGRDLDAIRDPALKKVTQKMRVDTIDWPVGENPPTGEIALSPTKSSGRAKKKHNSFDQHGAGNRFGNKRKSISEAKVLARRQERKALKQNTSSDIDSYE